MAVLILRAESISFTVEQNGKECRDAEWEKANHDCGVHKPILSSGATALDRVVRHEPPFVRVLEVATLVNIENGRRNWWHDEEEEN